VELLQKRKFVREIVVSWQNTLETKQSFNYGFAKHNSMQTYVFYYWFGNNFSKKTFVFEAVTQSSISFEIQ